MVGEPVGASLGLIVAMLGAWLCAMGIGAYVAWAYMRGVGTSTTEERAEVHNESSAADLPTRQMLNEANKLKEPQGLAGLQARPRRLVQGLPMMTADTDPRRLAMRHLQVDLKNVVEDNENFRQVLFTGQNSQLVVMALGPGEDIGEQTHEGDRFVYVVEGSGEIQLPGWEADFNEHSAACIPAGTVHNIVNLGDEPMKLFTIVSPPELADGTVHVTKSHAVESA
jgi:mannose-6-phosphate isomerase-like protein (cupin superfamily)